MPDSFCLNPDCPQPKNQSQAHFCLTCGSPTTENNQTYPFYSGKYHIIKVLGEGAFGRAYQAEEPKLFNRPCVIKKFIANFKNRDDLEYARQTFEREARQLISLKHPQIPTLYDYLNYDLNGVPSLYLVQEWITGQNLAEMWHNQGNFSQEQVRGFLKSLLPVLGYLHDNKIIHRDIKPNNIMLQAMTGQYMLIDFGGAKGLAGEALKSTRAIHTPGYAAMEQLNGQACEESDLYSLAVTAVRLMTGCFPKMDRAGNIIQDAIFDGRQGRWVWRQHLEQQGVKVAPDLVTVLEKCLQPFAAQRYRTAWEALAILDGEVTTPKLQQSKVGQQAAVNSQNKTKVVNQSGTSQPQGGFFGKLQQFFNGESESGTSQPQLSFIPPTQQSSSPISRQLLTRQQQVQSNVISSPPKSFVEDLGNGVKLEMVLIPKGSFLMGSSDSDPDALEWEKPQHQVEITQAFYLGKYQITQGQWQTIVGYNPARFQKGDRYPVEQVSWNDCRTFLNQLNQKTGKQYRLPSEAEWEYACQAGRTSRYFFGDDAEQLGKYCWFSQNSGDRPQAVGQKQPNNFGLFDMYGNVWEWCEDSFTDNYNTPRTQKPFVNSSATKVLRGGAWYNHPKDYRSAHRDYSNREFGLITCGFRVAIFN